MNKNLEIRKRIFSIIQIGNKEDVPSTAFDYFIVVVIFLNLAATFMSTFDTLSNFMPVISVVELITTIIFTIEYILRLWTADFLFPRNKMILSVLRFMVSFYGIIDLLTFLPYYLPFFFPAGAVAFRIFRVVRIFRLFKINAQSDAFTVIMNVLKNKKWQLMSSMVLILIFMLASSLCMYSLEHEAQPDSFQNAFSGIWWAVSTLLTVGYGDIYPVTVMGQLLGIIIAFLGVCMVAIPTGIISAGFVEEYNNAKGPKNVNLIGNPYDIFVEKDSDGAIVIHENDHTIIVKQNCSEE